MLYECLCLLKYMLLTGFDVGDLSEEGPSDVEGLDSSAAHVANLLSTEPADSMCSINYRYIYFSCSFPVILPYKAHTG